MEKENLRAASILASIIGASLIIGVAIWSGVFYQTKQMENALTVTGSAKERVTSDLAKLKAEFSRNVGVTELNFGYSAMKKDEALVDSFFRGQSFGPSDLTITPVMVSPQYDYNKGGGVVGYSLRQTVSVSSKDVDKITNLAKNIQPLVDQGVFFTVQGVEYYYTKLADLRLQLLSQAVKDAQARAQNLVSATGKKVGALKNASVGVVQVLAPDSIDVSDYGSYDLSTKEKDVMVTTRVQFVVK